MVEILSVDGIFWSVCRCVVSQGIPPTAPLDRDHFPRSVGHLFRYLVDINVLHVCILSDVDKDALYQGDFFVGPENILYTTLEQLTEAYCEWTQHLRLRRVGQKPK